MNDEARPNLEPIEKMVDELGVGAVFGEPIKEGSCYTALGGNLADTQYSLDAQGRRRGEL